MLIYYNSIRRRHRLTRSVIFQPTRPPWRHQYYSSDKGYFLNLTDFSRAAFEELHDFLYGDQLEYVGAGRPKVLDTKDKLELVLFYLGSSMKISELCLIFGCVRQLVVIISMTLSIFVATTEAPSESQDSLAQYCGKGKLWLLTPFSNNTN